MANARQIAVAEFKAKCLELMSQVQRTKVSLIITRHGKPVGKLVPVESPTSDMDFFGCMKGTTRVVGDIVGSVGESWEADE